MSGEIEWPARTVLCLLQYTPLRNDMMGARKTLLDLWGVYVLSFFKGLELGRSWFLDMEESIKAKIKEIQNTKFDEPPGPNPAMEGHVQDALTRLLTRKEPEYATFFSIHNEIDAAIQLLKMYEYDPDLMAKLRALREVYYNKHNSIASRGWKMLFGYSESGIAPSDDGREAEESEWVSPGPEEPATNGIVFFDFDYTLTQNHTGGELGVEYNQEEVPVLDSTGNPVIRITYNDVLDAMGGLERQSDVIQMIMQVRRAGYLVYINTRGLEECCRIALNTIQEGFVGPGRWIEGVVGATKLDQIADPYTDSPPHMESEDLWARRKTELMDMVTAWHGTDKENALFFDDTQLNIDYARDHGYLRSYVVSPENVIATVRDRLSLPVLESRYQVRRVIVEPGSPTGRAGGE